jgi:hypothetical protein
MEDKGKGLLLSAIGFAIGVAAAYHAISNATNKIITHFNRDLKNKVSNYCGADLTDKQWAQFMKTPEWLAFRTSLPLMSNLEIAKRLLGPKAMFYTGTALAGVSLFSFLHAARTSTSDKDTEMNVAIGFSAAVIVCGKLFLFNKFTTGLVMLESIPADHPVCEKARNISQHNSVMDFEAVGDQLKQSISHRRVKLDAMRSKVMTQWQFALGNNIATRMMSMPLMQTRTLPVAIQ